MAIEFSEQAGGKILKVKLTGKLVRELRSICAGGRSTDLRSTVRFGFWLTCTISAVGRSVHCGRIASSVCITSATSIVLLWLVKMRGSTVWPFSVSLSQPPSFGISTVAKPIRQMPGFMSIYRDTLRPKKMQRLARPKNEFPGRSADAQPSGESRARSKRFFPARLLRARLLQLRCLPHFFVFFVVQ